MALYSTKVYRVEDELVVESGGKITVKSGGALNFESGGGIAIAAGGKITEPAESGTTAANLKNYGITKLTQTAKKVYTLAAPVAGVRKTIYSTVHTTSCHAYVYSGSASVAFTTASTQRALRFSKAACGWVSMIALTTARWLVLGKTTSVAYTTSTTGG